MKIKFCLVLAFFTLSLGATFSQKIVLNNGLYFTDITQNKLYSGEYREFYESGELRLEVFIKEGKPEGSYVVYFENGKPQEVRAYHLGEFHGIWRSYNVSGMLIAEAEYIHNLKHGKWKVWDDNGVLRYEMNYMQGKKVGVWYMWDEKGKLTSEKRH